MLTLTGHEGAVPERAATKTDAAAARGGSPNPESRQWLARLSPGHPDRGAALAQLRALLVKAARWEVARRGVRMSGGEGADLAEQSADDALLAVLAKLHTFRGDSRFTTWAYKFALYEAAVKVRRQSWRGREVPLEEPPGWYQVCDPRQDVHGQAETSETLEKLAVAIREQLTPHQREVLVAIALNGVPVDVLAERLNTTRGALYKTLHDARRRLREGLAGTGIDLERARGR